MYIRKLRIKDFKVFKEEVTFDFTQPDGDSKNQSQTPSMWNVIVSENGCGKTTVLQAIALALMGQEGIKNLNSLFREIKQSQVLGLALLNDQKVVDLVSKIKKVPEEVNTKHIKDLIDAEIQTEYLAPHQWGSGFVEVIDTEGSPHKFRFKASVKKYHADKSNEKDPLPDNTILLGYGGFRRFKEEMDSELHYSSNKIGHHLGSLFDHTIPLFIPSRSLWLVAKTFDRVKGLFPDEIKLQTFDDYQENHLSEIRDWQRRILEEYLNANQITINTLDDYNKVLGAPVFLKYLDEKTTELAIEGYTKDDHLQTPDGLLRIDDTSDGYRMMMALCLDILLTKISPMKGDALRKAVNKGLSEDEIRSIKGIVLIDEIDAHLHPRWQREIGVMLQKFFPGIQFFVTTHSPFIPQQIPQHTESHYERLNPKRGKLFILYRNKQGVVQKKEKHGELIEGYGIEEALNEIFGVSGYSKNADQKIKRFAELRVKEIDELLSPSEKDELDLLRKWVNLFF